MSNALRATRIGGSRAALVLASSLLAGACSKPEAAPVTATSAATAMSAAAPAPLPAAAPREYKAADADDMQLQWELGKMPIPEDNPQSDAKVELGHQLFFDKRLSIDSSRSCYSCHRNEDGNGGHESLAIGAQDKKLTRHSPVIWNVGYLGKLYWDGRADSLEAQATAALEGGNMGLGKDKLPGKVQQLAKIPGYKKQFDAAFPGIGATATTLVRALSAYERTLVCNDTAYDKYAKGDKSAMTDAQKRGFIVFTERAKCDTCHTPPFFSMAYASPAAVFFNVGIGTEGKADKDVDVGRMGVTKSESDWAAFKPPSLRNVSNSAPYFHDGSRPKLEDAVRFMAGGGHENKNRTPIMVDKKLSDDEVQSIVTFLGALACEKLVEPKKLP
jgi:cytochrome c peroxidase